MSNEYDEIMKRLEWYRLPQHLDATKEYLDDLELTIHATLPEQYRQFVMQYGVVATRIPAAFPSILNDGAPVGGGGRAFWDGAGTHA